MPDRRKFNLSYLNNFSIFKTDERIKKYVRYEKVEGVDKISDKGENRHWKQKVYRDDGQHGWIGNLQEDSSGQDEETGKKSKEKLKEQNNDKAGNTGGNKTVSKDVSTGDTSEDEQDGIGGGSTTDEQTDDGGTRDELSGIDSKGDGQDTSGNGILGFGKGELPKSRITGNNYRIENDDEIVDTSFSPTKKADQNIQAIETLKQFILHKQPLRSRNLLCARC